MSANPDYIVKISPNRVSLETAREIIRLSELHLDGTVRFGLASDSRAASISGILSAWATASLTAGLGLILTDPTSSRLKLLFGIGALAASLNFMFALWNTVAAARPRSFSVGGTDLSNWRYKSNLYGSLSESLLEQAEIYHTQIENNKYRLTESSRRLERAFTAMQLAPLTAAVAMLVAYFVLGSLNVTPPDLGGGH